MAAFYLVDYGKKRRATLHFCQRKFSCVGPALSPLKTTTICTSMIESATSQPGIG